MAPRFSVEFLGASSFGFITDGCNQCKRGQISYSSSSILRILLTPMEGIVAFETNFPWVIVWISRDGP